MRIFQRVQTSLAEAPPEAYPDMARELHITW
jgi:hypothetical protein